MTRRLVILGCGTVGSLAGRLLVARGWQVTGIRRTTGEDPGFPLLAADACDPGLWSRLARPEAVLLTATPGVRRGRDHRLDLAVNAIPAGIRVVYSGTTAVYGDAAGAAVDEDGPLDDGAGPLLAIEAAVLAHGDACILRCPALIGPSRRRAQQRAREAAEADRPLEVPGDPDRPFSVLHEDDLAALLVEAVDGRLRIVRGVLNAAHPQPRSVREHYRRQAESAGVTVEIIGDGSAKPSRAISADRLRSLVPGFAWHDG